MQKDFEDLIGQRKQAQGVMEAHQGRGHGVYVKKQRGGGGVCGRLVVSSYVCKNQA